MVALDSSYSGSCFSAINVLFCGMLCGNCQGGVRGPVAPAAFKAVRVAPEVRQVGSTPIHLRQRFLGRRTKLRAVSFRVWSCPLLGFRRAFCISRAMVGQPLYLSLSAAGLPTLLRSGHMELLGPASRHGGDVPRQRRVTAPASCRPRAAKRGVAEAEASRSGCEAS